MKESVVILAGERLPRHSRLARFLSALRELVAYEVPSLRPAKPRRMWSYCWALVIFVVAASARAEIQFDVFLGYDGVTPTGGWIPVACEVDNDGLGFVGVFELTAQGEENSPVRRFTVELPTRTRKRFVLPAFSASRYTSWRARLVDEHGRQRASIDDLRATRLLDWSTPLLGVVGRGRIQVPDLPKIKTGRENYQPVAARLQLDLFPDNPLALDSLSMIYLNSAYAADLTPAQAGAIYTWMERGGHLVVAVDQISDISAVPWLEKALPMKLSSMGQVAGGNALQAWLKRPWRAHVEQFGGDDAIAIQHAASAAARLYSPLPEDPAFTTKLILAAVGTLREGTVAAQADGVPLVIESRRGYGKVTLLTFNPDRAPFPGWKNQPWFWVRLLDAPAERYVGNDVNAAVVSTGLDALVSTLIETRQVRKLPVLWLLVLLLFYLVVIGPFDWFTLKKLKRQMLTWVTFPLYVALFSGLIYYIGFKLRAGETEWNDLSVVDAWNERGKWVLSGRTYGSIYSPANERYKLGGLQPVVAIRGEYEHRWNSGKEIAEADLNLSGNRMSATAFVPIWTSRLFVSDWLDTAPPQIDLQVSATQGAWSVRLENLQDREIPPSELVVGERLFRFPAVKPHSVVTTNLAQAGGRLISEFSASRRQDIQNAISSHQSAFARFNQQSSVPDAKECVEAATFIPDLSSTQPQASFLTRDHLVILPEKRSGRAILLVWDDRFNLSQPVFEFSPPRQTRRNLVRFVVPVQTASSLKPYE